jgi:hypothetical protein
MRTLARKIQREFRSGHAGHYAVYEDELQRVWPLNLENRRAMIEQFAKEHGLQLSFYKQGLCAIFQPQIRASQSSPSGGLPHQHPADSI